MTKKKRLFIYTFILILISIIPVSCKSITDTQYVSISAEDGAKMLKEDPDIILIDVRTKQEFDEGHIDGSINIPDFELVSRIGEIVKDKNDTVILYCRSGNRSKQASLKLIEMGYKKIYDMGGLLDWPYETIKPGDN